MDQYTNNGPFGSWPQSQYGGFAEMHAIQAQHELAQQQAAAKQAEEIAAAKREEQLKIAKALAEAEAAEALHKRKEEEALVNKFQVGDRVKALKGSPDLTYSASHITKGKIYTVRKVRTLYNGKLGLDISTDYTGYASHTQAVDPNQMEFIERPKKKEEEPDVNIWTDGMQVVWTGESNIHGASWLTVGKQYTVRKYSTVFKHLTITTNNERSTQVVAPDEVRVVPLVNPLKEEKQEVATNKFKVGDEFTWPGIHNQAGAAVIKNYCYTVTSLTVSSRGPAVRFKTHDDGRSQYIDESDIQKVNPCGNPALNLKGVGKNMGDKLNTFWNNNYSVIIWIVLALLADNYFFKGAFQNKIKDLINGALDQSKKALGAGDDAEA